MALGQAWGREDSVLHRPRPVPATRSEGRPLPPIVKRRRLDATGLCLTILGLGEPGIARSRTGAMEPPGSAVVDRPMPKLVALNRFSLFVSFQRAD